MKKSVMTVCALLLTITMTFLFSSCSKVEIACDTCGKIYSVKDDKYFNLDDSENETIRNLLCEYGFKFPCL